MSQERARHDSEASEANQCFVKLRNLSKTTTEDDIREFLHPCAIIAVHLFAHDGEASNECVVELETEADVEDAKEKSNQEIDHQPIEVFAASVHEYNFHVKNQGTIVWNEPVLRMTGLPGGCTMADVQHFFDDIEIATNGIYITRDMTDTALGAGFVAFISMDNAYRAIDLYHQKYMGDRMIELSPSSYEEAKRIILDDARANAKQFSGEKEEMEQDNGQPESVEETKKSNNQHRSHSQSRSRSRSRTRENKRRYSRSPSRSPRSRQPPKRSNYRRRSRSRSPVRRSSPGSSRKEEFQVKMRGMPYTVSEEDIRKFFPSSCQPMRIEILQDRRMHRPNGDAYVYFTTFDEATEAMKCDRKYMGSRYIELYFDSPKYSALNHRRRRSYGSPRRVSPSPVKSRSNHYRRSRSDSDD